MCRSAEELQLRQQALQTKESWHERIHRRHTELELHRKLSEKIAQTAIDMALYRYMTRLWLKAFTPEIVSPSGSLHSANLSVVSVRFIEYLWLNRKAARATTDCFGLPRHDKCLHSHAERWLCFNFKKLSGLQSRRLF